MLKPNWPLVGIVAGAAVTAVIVILIFVSSSVTSATSSVPTTVALPKVPTATEQKTLSPALTDACAYAVIDGMKSFAVWPKGFTRQPAGDVVEADGTTFGEDDTASAATITTTASHLLTLEGGGNDGYLGTLLSRCTAGGSRVTIITKFTG